VRAELLALSYNFSIPEADAVLRNCACLFTIFLSRFKIPSATTSGTFNNLLQYGTHAGFG
jgi:hypothetical protein